jgi:hypothetical protein
MCRRFISNNSGDFFGNGRFRRKRCLDVCFGECGNSSEFQLISSDIVRCSRYCGVATAHLKQ